MAPRPGRITLTAESPKLTVTGTLTGPVDSPLPRPKYEQMERYGFYDLPRYTGQEPFLLPMQIKLGGEGASVESDIRALELMMERPEGRDAPPDVKVSGPVPHSTLTWRLTSAVEDKARTVYEPRGDNWHRVTFVCDVTLIQRVTETALSASTQASRSSKGIGSTTKVRDGEEDLYDVAQRYYHNSSFAIAISKANPVKGDPMPLGTRLRVGQTLVMP